MMHFKRLWIIAHFLLAGPLAAAGNDPLLSVDRPPHLSPDYAGITIPLNIAPLNFRIVEPGLTEYRVLLHSTRGSKINLHGRSETVEVPPGAWRGLLRENPGEPLLVDVAIHSSGSWKTFQTVTNPIASDAIDEYLAYRLLRPVYSIYGPIGIYQRNLTAFDERPVLENTNLNQGCLNCHTFLRQSPDQFALHIRNKQVGNPMLLVRSNQVTRVDKTSGYISWHPSGRLLAFSANKFSLLFHTKGETRDLYDAASDLGILRLDQNKVVHPPAISRPDRAETWPSWAPDGKHLYFCDAPNLRIERLKQIRYDLKRVSYDIETDQWGKPETLVSAQETRLSAAQPRVSPDGQWLLYCLAPNGNFPAYQVESDLYLMNLNTRTARRLDEINSPVSDSWHCWSSNGRWVVFSSKRQDEVFTRPFLTHMTAAGSFSKPFILPQAEPTFYDSFTRTFNLPEFIQKPISVTARELARGVFEPSKTIRPAPPAQAPAIEHEAEEGRGEGRK